MDKAYDDEPVHQGCMARDFMPVTAPKDTAVVKRGARSASRRVHGEWTFAGADFKRKATKWRCPIGGASPVPAGEGAAASTR